MPAARKGAAKDQISLPRRRTRFVGSEEIEKRPQRPDRGARDDAEALAIKCDLVPENFVRSRYLISPMLIREAKDRIASQGDYKGNPAKHVATQNQTVSSAAPKHHRCVICGR
jgi:hypothetical protein